SAVPRTTATSPRRTRHRGPMAPVRLTMTSARVEVLCVPSAADAILAPRADGGGAGERGRKWLEEALGDDDHVVGREGDVPLLAAALDHVVEVDDEGFLAPVPLGPDDLGPPRRGLVGEPPRHGDRLDGRRALLELVRPGLPDL